jgi:predicted acyltransferase (DUF342 family)
MIGFSPAILAGITGVMVAVPLTPALRELRKPLDSAALPIQQHDARTVNFARAFRQYIEPMRHLLDEAVEEQTIGEKYHQDGTGVVFVGTAAYSPGPNSRIEAVTLFGHTVLLPEGIILLKESYGAVSIWTGRHNLLRALLAEQDICLGERTCVLRWIHAERNLSAASACTLYGRTSAGNSISLAPGCTFERVHAPTINTSLDTDNRAVDEGVGAASTVDRRLGRFRVHGDLRLRDSEVMHGNLIARHISIAERCFVRGSLKAKHDAVIGSGTRIDGSIVVGESLHIGEDCYIRGPVLAEGCIAVGRGTRIGSFEVPTTISAPAIHLRSGAVVHGTIRARQSGQVEL